MEKVRKLSMCRICLVENVRMFLVIDKNLQDTYKQLTGIPFVTEDSRPMLACFFCCSRLKQCCRFQRTCLEAEALLTRILNEDYVHNQAPLELYGGFIITPTETISEVHDCQIESEAIKQEQADVIEEPLDIEVKVEHETDDKQMKNGPSDQNLIRTTTEFTETVALGNPNTCDIVRRNEMLSKQNVEEVTSNLNTETNCHKDEIKCKIGKNKAETSVNHLDDGGICFICDICSRVFARKTDLTRHIPIHTGQRRYKCDICGKCFTRRSSLTLHIHLHTDKKPYKCDVCQLSFRTRSGLKYHSRSHTGGPKKVFECEICQKSFSLKCHLNVHIRLHTGEKPYKCDVCERSFHTKSHLNVHIQTHTGLKPFKCDVCPKSFASRGQLNAHFRTHTGEKPHKCDLCERSFVIRSQLKIHNRTHTGEKPFTCDFCQRNFINKKNLKRHIHRRHTNRKTVVIKCDICHKSFSHIDELFTHFSEHPEDKPYKCNLCTRCYATKAGLKRHNRIKHK